MSDPAPTLERPRPVYVHYFEKPAVELDETREMRSPLPADDLTTPPVPLESDAPTPTPTPTLNPTPPVAGESHGAASSSGQGDGASASGGEEALATFGSGPLPDADADENTPAERGRVPVPRAPSEQVGEVRRPVRKRDRRRRDRRMAASRPPRLSKGQVAEMCLFGHRLFEEGRLDEARVVFEGLVGLGVDEPYAHTMLGTVYLALDDSSRALALFEAALALDPTDLAALVYRAELRLERGRRKAALEDLHRAVALGAAPDPFVERARRLLELNER